MNKLRNILLYALLWAFIAGFVIFFAAKSSEHYASSPLQRIEVSVSDDGNGCITSRDVIAWITADSVVSVGDALDSVDICRVEQSVREAECVESVEAYLSWGGTLFVDVAPRLPLLRLQCQGFNHYVTREGYVYTLPVGKSIYVPVVSGSYVPPFDVRYRGEVKSIVDSVIAVCDSEIARYEEEKRPFQQQIDSLDKVRRSIAKQRIVQYDDEPDAEYEKRLEYKQAEKRQKVRAVRYEQRLLGEQIAKLSAKQQAKQNEQKKLLKRYEDFVKLITFVEYIEDTPFWRSEIVQIEAYSTSSSQLALRLVPRSGSFIIEFGTPDNIETKLANLKRFYDEGLTNVGWNEFKRVSVEYSAKVVCSR